MGGGSNLDSIRDDLGAEGRLQWTLTPESYGAAATPFRERRQRELAMVAADILGGHQPITLRGLFYRVVSAGQLPDTGRSHYQRLGRLMTTLREQRIVPFAWIVDNVRATEKPSSWSGLRDFAEMTREAYRLDFWSELPTYVHVFCEKDAMSGVLAPVTREYDVALSVVRGYVSVSFAAQIADQWSEIKKPISAYYLGDLDPSGLDLERDLRAKLGRYGAPTFKWKRLGVLDSDPDFYGLLPLPIKRGDRRAQAFREAGHDACFELDAVPPGVLRERVREAVEGHIPKKEWGRLKQVEAVERESWNALVAKLPKSA